MNEIVDLYIHLHVVFDAVGVHSPQINLTGEIYALNAQFQM